MVKINLTKKILTVKGTPVTAEIANPEYEALSEKEKKKTNIPQTIKKELEVRDYLLTILSTKFPLLHNKEAFWTTELGILIANEKNKEIEISDDKAKFLKRILENNKIKQVLPMGGEREIELFFPYELGQLLQIFEENVPPPTEKTK